MAERLPMGWRGQLAWAALTVGVSLFCVTGCEPPGKPKQEPSSSQDITDFKALFGENCAGCHGANGRYGPARPLNDPLYLALIPRPTLAATIANGRPGTAMPAWGRSQGGPLTDKQIAALVDGMERNWAKPASLQGVALPSYAGQQSGDAVRGKKLFARSCYMCHGPGAPIGSVTDPALLELSSDQLLRTSIIQGRPDLGMPDYRTLNLGHALSEQDIADLVAYLVSLRPVEANVESAHVIENGSGQSGPQTNRNEGSGNGPGSPRKQQGEGNKGTGSSSERGVR